MLHSDLSSRNTVKTQNVLVVLVMYVFLCSGNECCMVSSSFFMSFASVLPMLPGGAGTHYHPPIGLSSFSEITFSVAVHTKGKSDSCYCLHADFKKSPTIRS